MVKRFKIRPGQEAAGRESREVEQDKYRLGSRNATY